MEIDIQKPDRDALSEGKQFVGFPPPPPYTQQAMESDWRHEDCWD